MTDHFSETVFVTGATGYIGGRLAPHLLASGHRVRCLTRNADKLKSRPWADDEQVEIVEGTVSDDSALEEGLKGCQVAYYLIHSMESAVSDYRSKDLALATAFGKACAKAGVSRIVYLGGLGELGEGLSKHLKSRREVESALQASGVPVTVLRAAMIIGAGSASFEILRYLVERLPIMITPKWVRTEAQPIAVTDVLFYLQEVLTVPETVGRTIDIGGPEILSYEALMRETASALGLRKRIIIPFPLLTPWLSSLWIHLVTPLSADIARPLAEGLRNRVVCRDDTAQRLMPHKCLSCKEAIAEALAQNHSDEVQTFWSDAGPMPGDPEWAGGTVFTDERDMIAKASPAQVWNSVLSLGGSTGYGGLDWLWRLRGALDKLAGGPGLRRGRRSKSRLMVGDSLDFWRVTHIEKERALGLTAEMKVPGYATLSFALEPAQDGFTKLIQTARFHPKGLAGIAYWYLVLPFHGFVFKRMLGGLISKAEESFAENSAIGVKGLTP